VKAWSSMVGGSGGEAGAGLLSGSGQQKTRDGHDGRPRFPPNEEIETRWR
jgi:hypothetical protein